VEECRVLCGGLIGSQPHGDVDAGVAKHARAPRGHGVRVFERDHHPADPSRENRAGAGRRLAMMGTRLQGDEQRGAMGLVAGGCDGHGLGVRGAVLGVPTFTHDLAVAENDSSDERIRRNPPPSPPGEVEGARHRGPLVQA
jgi:hypothetical protein